MLIKDHDVSQYILAIVEILSVALKWLGCVFSCNVHSIFQGAHLPLLQDYDAPPKHSYIIDPISAAIQIVVKNTCKADQDDDKFVDQSVNIELGAVNMNLMEHQLRDIAASADFLDRELKTLKYSEDVPKGNSPSPSLLFCVCSTLSKPHTIQNPSFYLILLFAWCDKGCNNRFFVVAIADNPRKWWMYAARCLMEKQNKKRRRWTASYIEERRRNRLEYVELYVEKLNTRKVVSDPQNTVTAENLTCFKVELKTTRIGFIARHRRCPLLPLPCTSTVRS